MSNSYRLTLTLFVILFLTSLSFGMGAKKTPVDWVDPTIDSANSRWIFFSSACRPFGMVNLSPDTWIDGAWNSGYCYRKEEIWGFSHIHAWQLSGISILPITGKMEKAEPRFYRSEFSHEEETVEAGYHSVNLLDYHIRAELTSTDRVGFHRYTFPKAEQATILVNLGGMLGPMEMVDCKVHKVNDTEIEGYTVNDKTRRRPNYVPVYFVARFDKPFKSFGGWTDGKVLEAAEEISGRNSGAFVTYETEKGEQILIKVGISYVSTEQARLNLETEIPHWDFDKIHKESREVWNKLLGKIEVEGGTDAQKIKFYTDLWHALLGRRLATDVNGKYREIKWRDYTEGDSKVHQVPLGPDGKPKYLHYNSDGFWGSQWNINLVWPLVCPDVLSNWCNALVDMYKNGGEIPRGPMFGHSSLVMIGAPTTPLIVSAYMNGIRNFDVETAYEGMRKNAFPGGVMERAGYEQDTAIGGGLNYYIERGYIPEGREVRGGHPDAVSQTLEYAYQDWCLGQLAKAIGKKDDYKLFMERAGNYKNHFDTETKFMRPRMMDGSWMTPFNPFAQKGFCEANAWQCSWMVPQDVQELIKLFGGRDEFTKKLNFAFEKAEKQYFLTYYGYINYGNQPTMMAGYLFNHAGKPWLTQKWIRTVKEKTYGGTDFLSGYGEDEDQGQMGALGVLMAIGLFDVQGGAAIEPIYEITSPIFDKITVHLDKKYYPADKFTIIAKNNSPQNIYIQSATLNGKPLNKPWFYRKELINGGTLVVELGPKPNENWGSKPEDAPPSSLPTQIE